MIEYKSIDIQQPVSRMYGKGLCYHNLFLKPNTSYMIYYKISFKHFYTPLLVRIFWNERVSPLLSPSFISMTEYKLYDKYTVQQSLLLILFSSLSLICNCKGLSYYVHNLVFWPCDIISWLRLSYRVAMLSYLEATWYHVGMRY